VVVDDARVVSGWGWGVGSRTMFVGG